MPKLLNLHVGIAGGVMKSKDRATNIAGQSVSVPSNIADDPAITAQRLDDLVRKLSRRVAELEAFISRPTIDFEINIGTSWALQTLNHGFGTPVRFWLVHWGRQPGVSYPTDRPALVCDASSTVNKLVLNCHVSGTYPGRAVVRVESTPYAVQI